MKADPRFRRRRLILGGAVGLLLLAAVCWAMINVFLNLPLAKHAIERKALQLVGAPLEVGHILVMPWGTLRLIDIRMVIPEAPKVREDSPPLVSCGEIRIAVKPFSLLTRNIRLRSIEIVDPVLSVIRSSSGGLMLPKRAGAKDVKTDDGGIDPEGPGSETFAQGESPMLVMPSAASNGFISSESLLADAFAEEGMQKEEEDSKGEATKEEVTKGEVSKGEVSKEEVPTEPGAVDETGKSVEAPKDKVVPTKEAGHPIVIRYRGRDVHFGEMLFRRGRLQVSSFDEGEVLMEVEGLEMAVNLGAGILQPGSVTARRITFFDLMEATDLRGEVVSNGLWIDFLNVQADVEGGRVEGRARASLFFSGIPFLAVIEAKDVAVGRIASVVAPSVAMTAGLLEGKLTLLGSLRHPSSYRGGGQIQVVGAHLGKSPILEPLSKVADVTALRDVAVNDVYVKFGVGGRNIAIDDLRASSQDITLAGRGIVGTQRYLNLALRLYLSDHAYYGVQAIEGFLPEGRSLGFIPDEGNAERFYRDYLITGGDQGPMINFWGSDENVPVAALKQQFIQLLVSARKDHLPGNAE